MTQDEGRSTIIAHNCSRTCPARGYRNERGTMFSPSSVASMLAAST